ncbi:MAG: UDP-N-acetylmuramoyl-L-alanine--D-glutamate ligase [Pseudomonadota bacterium]
MIDLSGLRGETLAVFGLGASGLSAIEALVAGGANVLAWDDKDAARKAAEKLGAKVERYDNWDWTRIASLVLAPGVPLTHPRPHPVVLTAREAEVEVIGDVELFARAYKKAPPGAPKIVAITGSNGKSTTTVLVAHLLNALGTRAVAVGNIGTPILSAPGWSQADIYVAELSSFQLDLTSSLKADVAVLLNITPDHLDRHGDMANYVAAKCRIFLNQTANDHAVIGVDDAPSQTICTELSSKARRVVTPVTVGAAVGFGVFAMDAVVYSRDGGRTETLASLKNAKALQGAHNWQNAAAALAVLRVLGVEPTKAQRALDSFSGLPHRAETVAKAGRLTFINDSKATNPEAAAKSLSAYSDVFWIAGGRSKSDDFSVLAGSVKSVRQAFFIGEAAETMKGAFPDIPSEVSGTLVKAVRAAAEAAEASDAKEPVILLAPACASFDQFTNFEARGDAFRALARLQARKADGSNGEAA